MRKDGYTRITTPGMKLVILPPGWELVDSEGRISLPPLLPAEADEPQAGEETEQKQEDCLGSYEASELLDESKNQG